MDRTRVRVSLWVSRNACWSGWGRWDRPRALPAGRELTHGRPLCWIRSASPEWGRHFAPSLARWKPRVYDDDEDDGPLVQYTFRMS